MKYDFNGIGITLENVKEFEEELANYKKSLRESDKQEVADRKANAIVTANSLIDNGTLVKGISVVVMYNKQEVVGTLTNTPTRESKNIPVTSESFNNKDKFLYVDKTNFVRVA